MICCICANVPWDKVKELQAQGLSTEEIKEQLNLGKDCGLCMIAVEQEIKK